MANDEMTTKNSHFHLSRRERQIMDVIYQMGRSTSAEVRECIPDPPGYSAVRAMLRVLEQKGYVHHQQDGPRYVFLPTIPRSQAQNSALQHLIRTFFDGSCRQVLTALLDREASNFSAEDWDWLAKKIERARAEAEVD